MNSFQKVFESSLRWIYFTLEYGRIRKKRSRFMHREAMEVGEIYAKYYSERLHDQTRFEYVWNRMAEVLQLDRRRLRPLDRFSVELAPVEGAEIDDELDELEEFFLEEAARIGIIADIENIRTLDDIIIKLCN